MTDGGDGGLSLFDGVQPKIFSTAMAPPPHSVCNCYFPMFFLLCLFEVACKKAIFLDLQSHFYISKVRKNKSLVKQ